MLNVFLSHSAKQKGYVCFDLKSGIFYMSKNVMFNEVSYPFHCTTLYGSLIFVSIKNFMLHVPMWLGMRNPFQTLSSSFVAEKIVSEVPTASTSFFEGCQPLVALYSANLPTTPYLSYVPYPICSSDYTTTINVSF